MSVVHVVVPTVLTEMFRSRSVLGVYRVMFYINRVEKNSALTFDLCDTSFFPCLIGSSPSSGVHTITHLFKYVVLFVSWCGFTWVVTDLWWTLTVIVEMLNPVSVL